MMVGQEVLDLLHPRVRSMALDEFNRGSWLGAIRCACVEVENAIRELAGELNTRGFIAVRKLISQMFGLEEGEVKGPRTIGLIPHGSERDLLKAREDLGNIISGVIGYYRNPPMHHNIKMDSTQSMRIMIICSEILYEIDACAISFDKVGIDGLVKTLKVDSEHELAVAIRNCDFDDFLNDYTIFQDSLAQSGLNPWHVSVLQQCGLVECESHDCYDEDGEFVDEIFRYKVTPLGRSVLDLEHRPKLLNTACPSQS
jgi:hypothetical protein